MILRVQVEGTPVAGAQFTTGRRHGSRVGLALLIAREQLAEESPPQRAPVITKYGRQCSGSPAVVRRDNRDKSAQNVRNPLEPKL